MSHRDDLHERILAAEHSVCRLPRDPGESCSACEARADAVLAALGLEQVGWMWPVHGNDWGIGWLRDGDPGDPDDVPLYRLRGSA